VDASYIIFVGRGFSPDIKNSENEGIQPLKFYQIGADDHS
jgi:hypothetical protein